MQPYKPRKPRRLRKIHKPQIRRPDYELYENNPREAYRINNGNYGLYDYYLEEADIEIRNLKDNLRMAENQKHDDRTGWWFIGFIWIILFIAALVISHAYPDLWLVCIGVGIGIVLFAFFVFLSVRRRS